MTFISAEYRIRKYVGVFALLGALVVSLTGCITNLPDIFGTPTPSPTPNPNVVIDPKIDLDPIGGYAGTLVRVTGEGWLPEKLVILKLEDEEGRSGILAANIPDSQGLFQASFNYPSGSRWLRPGFSSVVAYALNEDLETTTQFVVIEPTPTATSESAGSPTPTGTNTATATARPTSTATSTDTPTPLSTSTNTSTSTPTNTQASPATSTPTGTSTGTSTPLPVPTDSPTQTPASTPTLVNAESEPTETETPLQELPTATAIEFILLPTATPTATNDVIETNPTETATVTTATATTAMATRIQETPVPDTLATETPVPNDGPQEPDSEVNAPEPTTVVSSEQVSTPSGEEAPAETTPTDGSTPNPNVTPTVIVVSIAPTGTVPVVIEANGTPTVELGPFPSPAEPTATPNAPTFTPTWTRVPEIVVIEEWRGDYWPNPDLLGPPLVIRNDRTIDFEWAGGSPAAEIPSDNFSARWSRTLRFEEGIFTFIAEVDDGARLYVDGQLVIDSWEIGGRRTLTGQKILSEGQHQVVFEYFDSQGNATARLGWSSRATFQGWRGEYFANIGLNGRPVLVRDDATINFEWGVDGPAPTLPEDGFSVRWLRRLNLTGGNYRFSASADDGIRVWVDDLLIIDEWRDQSEQEFTAEISLARGVHDIRVEYYENTLGAIAKFGIEEIVEPTVAPTPTWTEVPTAIVEPTATWTPVVLQPTPTWTPAR